MNDNVVKDILAKETKESLIDIIIRLSRYDDYAEDWLYSYCEKKADQKYQRALLEDRFMNLWIDGTSSAEMFAETDLNNDRDEAQEAFIKLSYLVEDNEFDWEFVKDWIPDMLEATRGGRDDFSDQMLEIAFCLCRSQENVLYLCDALIEYDNEFILAHSEVILEKLGNPEAKKIIKAQIQKKGYRSYRNDT